MSDRTGAPVLVDVGRLRRTANVGEQRLKNELWDARTACHSASCIPESAERVALLAMAAALIEARLQGYRAAVADMLPMEHGS